MAAHLEETTPMASWNQKYNLYVFAKQQELNVVYDFLDKNQVTQKPMTIERYKLIRNAILYNEPIKALELLKSYGEAVK